MLSYELKASQIKSYLSRFSVQLLLQIDLACHVMLFVAVSTPLAK
jgi:hypothetical protein